MNSADRGPLHPCRNIASRWLSSPTPGRGHAKPADRGDRRRSAPRRWNIKTITQNANCRINRHRHPFLDKPPAGDAFSRGLRIAINVL